MSEVLGALFHWSPQARRREILRQGLRPYAESPNGDASWPWVCLGFTPSAAWSYSVAVFGGDEPWDLWQVRLEEGDEVHIRAEFSPVLKEVRVHNAIPADRLWWIGTRVDLPGLSVMPPDGKPRELRLRPDGQPALRLSEADAGLVVQVGTGKGAKRTVLGGGHVAAVREWV